MQLNTIIKLGSLAFDVASDQKVRELAGLVHQGARRRGLIGAVPNAQAQAQTAPVGAPSHWPKQTSPIPFAPGSHPGPPLGSGSVPAMTSKAPSTQAPKAAASAPIEEFDLKKWATMDNAKKVLGWAGSVTQFLTK
ncbi:hypothetical protein NZD89_21650 [Alicyclobacillus fastidiosus]|uniref:Uncharacterized protein n=1 Tax=Alicyclobacillus fastidiosus TaxID=392011 RepID=A0ABY6ZDF3_9BACL|nr:hypothetical protein [Alicyclobacillus fastidiosus]WAH40869.1 hypothetical protein NZD89_21650 [Alicyclobacillus fastidiosus]GMA62358.1 hypothetical protein GCM10025859_27980 [Alicyclobacillus fastidiosus]